MLEVSSRQTFQICPVYWPHMAVEHVKHSSLNGGIHVELLEGKNEHKYL